MLPCKSKYLILEFRRSIDLGEVWSLFMLWQERTKSCEWQPGGPTWWEAWSEVSREEGCWREGCVSFMEPKVIRTETVCLPQQ